ncbi:regulatory protein RecX [candidate division KSB1 bacterium]
MRSFFIESIEKLKRRKNRFKCIFASGEFIELPDFMIVKYSLSEGKSISEKTFNELFSEAAIEKGKEQAFRLLSYRARSKNELKNRIVQSGLGINTAETVVNDLEKIKLIDDEEFAFSFVRDIINRKPAGEFLVKNELKKKGIKEDIINKVVNKVFSEIDRIELARKGMRQWIARHPKTGLVERRKKIADFLYRRGFSWSTIEEVVGDDSAIK